MVAPVPLTSLHPHWLAAGGEGVFNADHTPAERREGIGIDFDCPCDKCTARRTGDEDKDFHLRHPIIFTNPLDGKPTWAGSPNRPTWFRSGDTFETLVLSPSILSDANKGGCGWHGYVGGAGGEAPGMVITL